MIEVAGYFTTPFGELWKKSLFDLVEDAIVGIFKNTDIDRKQIDAIFFGNMLAGTLENNLHTPSRISEIIGLSVPVFRVESACASGGIAFHLGVQYLEANRGKNILVIGAEKMTDYSPEEVTMALTSASSGEEQESGISFPGLYAMMARVYLEKYRYSRDVLGYVGYKNHYHGSLNQNAHFRKKISYEDTLQSPYIADPLRLLDCSPISDGASAVLLSSDPQVIKRRKVVRVVATECSTDSISLKNRASLDGIEATRVSAGKAFHKAKIQRNEIQVAEVHDCFSIAELFAMEDIGFWKKGDGGKRIQTLETMLGSESSLTVNTSGGLKSAGHPVGATGIKQIGEVYLQLTQQAERRQVKKVRYGLAHNVGGSGGSAVITILGV